MRLTKDNIDKYINKNCNLNLYFNKEITHIDYLPDNITYINIECSYVEEITCELPDGLETFYCYYSKLTKLPLLPKSLYSFDGRGANLPKEFNVLFIDNNIQCNRLRKLQLIELI